MKIKFLLVLAFASVLLLGCQSVGAEKETSEPAVQIREGAQEFNVGNKICPVSGEEIDEESKAAYEYNGVIYNFCSPECIEEFKKDPQKYVDKVEKELKAQVEEKERQRQEDLEKQFEPVQDVHEEHLY